jgi:hypothetical protein
MRIQGTATMREIQIVILLPVIAILSSMAFRQAIDSFGLPPEADMDSRLFPEKY